MEGFHMFQDKIQSEINREYSRYEEPAEKITSRSHLYLEFEEDEYETIDQGLNFSLDYEHNKDSLRMAVEDFHEIICAFGNDIEMEGKKILLFYQ